jgi:hypothetical protein
MKEALNSNQREGTAAPWVSNKNGVATGIAGAVFPIESYPKGLKNLQRYFVYIYKSESSIGTSVFPGLQDFVK